MSGNATTSSTAPRHFAPFRVLSAEERRRHLEGYQRYLSERDGELDLDQRKLSRRESYFLELARKPVAWDADVDYDGFYQHFHGVGAPEIDVRTGFLVAVAKANESESYGVELEIDRFLARGLEHADVPMLYIILEEHYHTRILLEACRTCGLDVTFGQPPWHRRAMIQLIYRLPESVRWIPVLAGEAVASVALKVLRDSTHLFSSDPEVEERLRSLLHEIWTDEVFHVAFLRARLRPLAVRIARLILPGVASALLKDVPYLRDLGCSQEELVVRARSAVEIPPGVKWMEADAIPPE